ncbi:GmrSD restriction endonuclease domain-containing protein [Cellulomonas sp. URHB0016]
MSPRTKVGLVGLTVVSVLGLVAGPGGACAAAGLYLAGTGLWSVVRGTSWLGRHARGVSVALLVGGLVMSGLGVSSTAASPDGAPQTASTAAPTTAVPSTAAPSPTAVPPEPTRTVLTPAPEPTPEVEAQGAAAGPPTALATALRLEVKGRAARTGYDRDLFGHGWGDVDRNGCDTRNDILARDLADETFKAGTGDCVVLTGSLTDPYSARTIAFVRGAETSGAVQIDHVVALSDAWQKGAQAWDEPTRVRFANDPMNLLAVDGPLNMQKGDGDTATWLPPNKAYRCAYVARQVGVKVSYGLWVSEAERGAMVSVLSTCPGEPLPDGSSVPPVPTSEPAPVTAARAPAPGPAVAEPEAERATVYYSSCAAARAAGAAPVHLGDPGYGPHLDRDHDGVGCES